MTNRDSSGRFISGHGVKSPGRPRREFEEKYVLALTSRTTAEDWQLIIDRAIADAKRGDWRARQWLADYIIGKPVQQLDIDTTNKILEVQYINDWRGDIESPGIDVEKLTDEAKS